MNITMLFIAALMIALLTHIRHSRAMQPGRDLAIPRPPTSEPAPLRAINAVRPVALLPIPDLQMLEWTEPSPPESAPAPQRSAEQARIRQQYLAARFPGVLRDERDLENIHAMIEAARYYLDETKFDRAHELLDLAIEVSPQEESLRLAQLEIAFLKRDGARYLALAKKFREVLPESAEWPEVERLGLELLPAEEFFRYGAESSIQKHYGPWPGMPNWIGASWDLTAEVSAADFHHAMARAAACDGAVWFRNAA